MRVWEFEDNKAIPSDLVREQDFILRVRRLQRLGTPHLVVNLVLSAIESIAKSRRATEAVQERLKEFAKVTNGVYAEMSNGDVFIVWEETADAQLLSSRILSAVMPDQAVVKDTSKFLLTYHMPKDYVPLRERTNHYIEVVRTASTFGSEGAPAEALRSEAARGPLTAWSVDQIGKLLGDIDLRRYGRTQPVYKRTGPNTWAPVLEEYFISFDDLRRERFPHVEMTAEHLFLTLCETLDQRLLVLLTEQYDTIAGRPLNLNLSVASIMGSVFAQFAHRVPREQRGLIGFELHRGDLLQDFSLTLNALEVLHHEGFKTALDGITPDMIEYINLGRFDCDFIKINVSKDRAAQLAGPAVRKGLGQIPAGKIIFFRCDNEKALAAGVELGVNLFQGWLIDDAAHPKKALSL
jgi:EAL domain-containing protein (putative c-di-GMP-specific phosphodiesterase class I)